MRIAGIRTKFLAHRVSFELFNGHVGEGGVVMHVCDNPQCVNPEHIRDGTYKKNAREMVERGRCKVANVTNGRCPF